MADSVRFKLPNSNVITRKDKDEIGKKVETFNIKLSKFCKKNKIDIVDNKHLDDSCLTTNSSISRGKVILIKKIIFWIISIVHDTRNSCQFLTAAMFLG